MRRYLRQYHVELETIGPVHIGSGEAIRKNQWILDWGRKEAVIPEPRAMFEVLSQKGLLEQYEAYMMQPRPEPLFKWLEKQGLQRDIGRFTKYTLDISGVDFRKQNVRDMQLTMKDAYGLPYIPGSSLKGALRNVLLAKKISDEGWDDRKVAEEINFFRGNRVRYLKSEAERLETEFLYTKGLHKKAGHAVNDMMSGLRVGDSNSAGLDCLTLCQKIDMRKNGTESELPLVRECIRSGTRFCFALTIDTTETDMTIEYIRTAVREFLDDYNEMFLKEFRDEKLYGENVIYLGGGVGFPSKTVLNQVLAARRNRVELVGKSIDNTLPNKMKRHSRDKALGVSPSVAKLTEANGTLMQMGPCRIDIEPV